MSKKNIVDIRRKSVAEQFGGGQYLNQLRASHLRKVYGLEKVRRQ